MSAESPTPRAHWQVHSRPPTNAEGRPAQRFFSIPLKQTVALGEHAHHFCHVLGSPGAQRDNLVGQTAAERGQRVVHARRHLFVVGPRQHVIGLQFLQLLDQHLGAYAVDVALELAVALRAIEQEVQDQRLPLARDDAERGGEPVGVAATAVLILRAVSHFSWLPKGAYLSLGYQNCILVSSKQFPASVLLQRRMQHMTRLNGKTAVITGGATGIGRAAAKRFIEEDAFVFIFGRRQESLDAAVADLGPNARAVKGSVSDEADLDRLYAAVKAERKTLDIVFANAGVGSQLKLGEITARHIDETFDTNVKGTIFTVQKALPLMGKGGSIILTGSSAGTTGAPAFTAYSASKAAVRNLARTWAEDLKGTGIRVNVLSPGSVATELAKEALGTEGLKAFASMTLFKRMGDPAEVGAVAAFLASQNSSFMTASEVAVDGGLAQI